MKQMQLVAVALCLIMLTTVGAGVVAAKQTENPRQAGSSHIYFYDVKATDSHGKGKLQINVDTHTFEFNGQGFPPSQQIALKARAADSAEYKVFDTGKATPSGNLHIAGTWEAAAAPSDVVGAVTHPEIRGFELSNEGYFFAKIACYYSTDGGVTWKESSHSGDILKGGYKLIELSELDVPVGALVKIHAIVVAGNDRTGSQVFVYDPDGNGMLKHYAVYDISGTTLNSKLSGGGLVTMCVGIC